MSDNDDQWHLDKRVPISLIVTMVAQIVVVVWAIADIKKDVEILKTQQEAQHVIDARQDRTSAESSNVLYQRLEKIDAKLDRLIERAGK